MLTRPVGAVTTVGLFDAEHRARPVAGATALAQVERGKVRRRLTGAW